MAADWAFYAVAIRAGADGMQLIDEIPLSSMSITERLNAPGALSGTVPLRHPKVANLETVNTLIVAVRNGKAMWAGPILSLNWSGGDTVTLQAEGVWNLVRRRMIKGASNMVYGFIAAGGWGKGLLVFKGGYGNILGIEQFHIVTDLIDHMQGIRDDLSLSTVFHGPKPGGASGVWQRRQYETGKLVSIGETIEELADTGAGFDWAIEPIMEQGSYFIRFELHLYYPRQGQLHSVPLEWDSTGSRNVLAAGLSVSSANRVSRFIALGAGQGAQQLVASAGRLPSLYLSRPFTEGGGSWSDITWSSVLSSKALFEARKNWEALGVVTLTVDPAREPTLDEWGIGDTFKVTIDDGWAQMFEVQHRVISRNIKLDDDGAETVDMELAPLTIWTG